MSERVAILGGPKTGKTTLAATLGGAKSTDALKDTHDWSAASAEAAKWFADPSGGHIEGVAVARALRKFMAANPGKPCDRLIVLSKPYQAHTPGQAAMAKGIETVLKEITPELKRRGVVIERR